MTDDVACIERDDSDVVDPGKQTRYVDESAHRTARQIDLRCIAVDDHLRIRTQSREEHLELFACRVLRFIQNHECVAERTAAHVGERRDFDDAAFEVFCNRLIVQHFGECVVERAQIRIDFFFEITRQKTELLARFDGRSREDDLRDRTRFERTYGHDDCKKRLARSGRADAEGEGVGLDARNERALTRGLRSDFFSARRLYERRRNRARACGLRGKRHVIGRYLCATLRGGQHRSKDALRVLDGRPFPTDEQLFAVQMDDDRDQRFERRDILIVLPAKAERVGQADEFEGLFGRYACQRATS